MKLAIVGSRTIRDYKIFKFIMDTFISNHLENQQITEFVSGGANGVDHLAEDYAKSLNIPIQVIPAKWDKYGKSAGFKRNLEIWDNSDCGIAIWDGKSVGTKHSFEIAKKQDKPLLVVTILNGEIDIDRTHTVNPVYFLQNIYKEI